MKIAQYLKRAEKLVADNSPVILTSIGVVGTVGTAILTGKAAFKARQIIEIEQTNIDMEQDRLHPHEPYDQMGFKEKALLTWKFYIPAVAVGTTTVTAIVFANRIGTRRAAAIASAYALSEKAFEEYRSKVVEKIGETKEAKVREEIAQDRVNANPLGDREVVIVGDGNVLCYDPYSSRYFQSSLQDIKRVENEVNYKIINESYASLADFYSRLGLKPTQDSHEVGWTTDHPLEILYSAVLSDDERPCISIEFRVRPTRDFWRFH